MIYFCHYFLISTYFFVFLVLHSAFSSELLFHCFPFFLPLPSTHIYLYLFPPLRIFLLTPPHISLPPLIPFLHSYFPSPISRNQPTHLFIHPLLFLLLSFPRAAFLPASLPLRLYSICNSFAPDVLTGVNTVMEMLLCPGALSGRDELLCVILLHNRPFPEGY